MVCADKFIQQSFKQNKKLFGHVCVCFKTWFECYF